MKAELSLPDAGARMFAFVYKILTLAVFQLLKMKGRGGGGGKSRILCIDSLRGWLQAKDGVKQLFLSLR